MHLSSSYLNKCKKVQNNLHKYKIHRINIINTMQFTENKYTTWYYNIIYKATDVHIKGKTEHHHILPESLYPQFKNLNKNKWNGVHLTAREHFICHWLLTKMVTSKKQRYQMWNAFSCMLYRENKNQERYKISSRTFGNIKRNNSRIKSIMWSGKGNPMYGKTHSDAAKAKISATHKGRTVSHKTKQKLSKIHKDKPKSETHKLALCNSWDKEARSGVNGSFYGRTHSNETRSKIQQTMLSIPKKICPYCSNQHTPGNYARWHGDKCKMKRSA